MFITKATVQWDTSYAYAQLRILFYDQDGNLFESGDIISNNALDGETENFKVTHVGAPFDSRTPIYAVLTTSCKDMGIGSYCYFHSGQSTEALFTIEFKTIKPISKIKICTVYNGFGKRNLSLNIYDIRGNTESYIINGTSDYEGAIHEYDLQLDVYNVNEVGTTEITISSNTIYFLQFKI